jgi:hypothetical protein
MNGDEETRHLLGYPDNAGVGMLYHLRANPTLLDPAPTDRDTWGSAITHRSEDEVHACLRCGEQAQIAVIAETPDRPRWLDLCFGCMHWLRMKLNEAGVW